MAPSDIAGKRTFRIGEASRCSRDRQRSTSAHWESASSTPNRTWVWRGCARRSVVGDRCGWCGNTACDPAQHDETPMALGGWPVMPLTALVEVELTPVTHVSAEQGRIEPEEAHREQTRTTSHVPVPPLVRT